MADLEADIATAKRLSLLANTGTDRCAATSSAAPHAPLDALLKDLLKVQSRLEDYAGHHKQMSCSSMASHVKEWADRLHSVLHSLNYAEEQRSADVLRSVDWYNENLAACKKDCEKMMQAQKESYEKKIAWGMGCDMM